MLPVFVFLSALVACVQGLSDELFHTLDYTSFLAKNCYCVASTMMTGNQYMSHVGFDVALSFTPNYINQISCTGYVALDRNKKQIVIAFRGSVTLQDWIVDFNAMETNYVPLSGNGSCTGNCRVHGGVYQNFKQSYNNILNAVKELAKQHPDYPVVVTGHSLGGGYAYLMGIELQLLGLKPLVITYGGLKVGNQDTNNWVDELFKSEEVAQKVNNNETPTNAYYRVAQTYDIVPTIPSGPFFSHAGVLFTLLDDVSSTISKDSVRVDGYKPKISNFGSGGLGALTHMMDHMKYFRIGTPCLTDAPTSF